jgi:hypothetical protein
MKFMCDFDAVWQVQLLSVRKDKQAIVALSYGYAYVIATIAYASTTVVTSSLLAGTGAVGTNTTTPTTVHNCCSGFSEASNI